MSTVTLFTLHVLPAEEVGSLKNTVQLPSGFG